MTAMADRGKPEIRSGARASIVVADTDEGTRTVVANALRRRFGIDYEVVESETADSALERLEGMRRAGAETALIVANEHLSSGSGTDFLAATREVFPAARRLVLATFGDNWSMPS